MLLVLAIAGCSDGEATFFDGFGAKPEAPSSDDLADTPLGPYLVGSTVHVYARPPRGMRSSAALDVYSTDVTVLDVVGQTLEDEWVAADVEVVGEGEAHIELWKNDLRLGSTIAAAHAVASPEVRWAPGVLAKNDEIADLADKPGLVATGTATFQIAYKDDDGNPVYGSGLGVVFAGEPAVSAVATTEYQGFDGDWITVNAHVGPTGTIEFRYGQVNAGTYTFAITDDPTGTALALYTPSDDDASLGDTVYAAALALGSDETRYYGAPAAWEVDGESVGEVGEIFSYAYDPGATGDLSISLGALAAERTVNIAHGDAVSGGCAVLPRWNRLAFAGLLAALSRRRARSRPSDPPRR
jgi:hypothetical protein